MELHISVSKVRLSSVIKIDGALTWEGLPELERVVSPCKGALRLDLSELLYLDGKGVAAVQALRAGGAELVGASPYIALLIGPATRPARERKRGDARSKAAETSQAPTGSTHGRGRKPSKV